MCNLYRIETPQQAMRALFGIADDRLGNLPPLEEVFPDQMAPVIRVGSSGDRVAEMMRWGFPPAGGAKRPVTNVRNLDSSYWRTWLQEPWRRCLVTASAFCEYEGEKGAKVKRWFVVGDGEEEAQTFAFAGIWRTWSGKRGKEEGKFRLFSFLTTEANAVVAPIHPPAMPVLLADPDAWTCWLSAPWEEARSLAAPFAEERMTLLDVQPPQGDLLAGLG